MTTHLSAFVRSRHAAATAITAAVLTLMSLGGIALVSDHVWLVYQRDTLAAAADAASLATTKELARLSPQLSDQAVHTHLTAIAQRYVRANLPAKWRSVPLEMTLVPNRQNGTVRVTAQADLGGVLFGRWLYGSPVETMQVESGSEQQGSVIELVLAIDVTRSMRLPLRPGGEPRMTVVQRAARDLVSMLQHANRGTVAVGVVPWTTTVKFDLPTRTRLMDHGWVVYPHQRFYPFPARGHAGLMQPLPPQPRPWQGCPDQRALPLGLALDPPTPDDPLTMGFYPSRVSQVSTSDFSVAYNCLDPSVQRYCYHANGRSGRLSILGSQHGCWTSGRMVQPLTTQPHAITQAINGLSPRGAATYSAMGLVWAARLLSPTWQTAWGSGEFPVDPAHHPAGQKVVVLLTDGEDNFLPGTETQDHRRQVCTMMKQAGLTVFTIAALDTSGPNLRQLTRELTACATTPDHAFVNNATPESLEAAFQTIGQRVRGLRRMSHR